MIKSQQSGRFDPSTRPLVSYVRGGDQADLAPNVWHATRHRLDHRQDSDSALAHWSRVSLGFIHRAKEMLSPHLCTAHCLHELNAS